MTSILCYGDSLTYGANPQSGSERHAYEDRWPGALQGVLGSSVQVIAEGLGGRTTIFDDHGAAADRNGARILPTILESHSPLDLIIIMLGTNDLKPFHAHNALESSFGMRRLVEIIRGYYARQGDPSSTPKIILMSPPHATTSQNAEMDEHFGADAVPQSRLFAQHYKRRADELGVGFFDAATVAKVSPLDGIHLDAANTKAIGVGLAPLVKSLLGL